MWIWNDTLRHWVAHEGDIVGVVFVFNVFFDIAFGEVFAFGYGKRRVDAWAHEFLGLIAHGGVAMADGRRIGAELPESARFFIKGFALQDGQDETGEPE